MKREDVAGLVIYILIFAVAVVYGVAVLHPYYAQSSFSSPLIYALFILGALVSGVVLSAIFEELGHALGAKMGGYTILSVNILRLCFYKDGGKRKIKFAPFDGLTGETKILPKSEKSNPTHYLLMGTLFNSIFTAGFLVTFYILLDAKDLARDFAYFFLTAGGVELICLIYNLLPAKLDSLNDGYRLSLASNASNKLAFNELLRVEYELANGASDVEIKTFTELTNFTAELNMNKVYLLLDKQDYRGALDLIEIVISNKKNLSYSVYLRGLAMKVTLLALLKEENEYHNYVDNNIDIALRKEFFDDGSFASIRAYLLLAGISDNSKSECLLVLNKLYRAYKLTPKKRRNNETDLFNKTLDLLKEKHPKWEELDKYRFELDTEKGEK